MQKINYKSAYIVIVTIVAIVFVYLYFKPTPVDFDQQLIQMRVDSLDAQNKRLISVVGNLTEENKAKATRINALENLKPQIEKVYVQKSNEIDNSNAIGVIVELNDVFTTERIR